MPTIIDEDIIRQKPVSDAYRDGWERCFGDKAAPSESKDCDAMTVVLTMPIVNATFTVPECSCPHQDANEPMHDLDCPCYTARRA